MQTTLSDRKQLRSSPKRTRFNAFNRSSDFEANSFAISGLPLIRTDLRKQIEDQKEKMQDLGTELALSQNKTGKVLAFTQELHEIDFPRNMARLAMTRGKGRLSENVGDYHTSSRSSRVSSI